MSETETISGSPIRRRDRPVRARPTAVDRQDGRAERTRSSERKAEDEARSGRSGEYLIELLREPEIVAWLEDYRPRPEESDDEPDPPRAA